MSLVTSGLTRRAAIKHLTATGLAVPAVFRVHAGAAPSETVYHASFGASGMAGADLHSITASPHVKLVAVADVDLRNTVQIKKEFPDVRIYQDWRELLDKEKHLDSANISTPDHMHASITMRAMQQGLNVYTQKPLTQTIYEARQLTRIAREKKLVTQMGIQIHSHEIHRMVVEIIQNGAIGKVKEVHSWSGKYWGDPRLGLIAVIPCLRSSTGTPGWEWRRSVLSSPVITIPASGGSGLISAPAPLVTWAAIFSTPSSRRWP